MTMDRVTAASDEQSVLGPDVSLDDDLAPPTWLPSG